MLTHSLFAKAFVAIICIFHVWLAYGQGITFSPLPFALYLAACKSLIATTILFCMSLPKWYVSTFYTAKFSICLGSLRQFCISRRKFVTHGKFATLRSMNILRYDINTMLYIDVEFLSNYVPGVPPKNWTLFDFMWRKSYRSYRN